MTTKTYKLVDIIKSCSTNGLRKWRCIKLLLLRLHTVLTIKTSVVKTMKEAEEKE